MPHILIGLSFQRIWATGDWTWHACHILCMTSQQWCLCEHLLPKSTDCCESLQQCGLSQREGCGSWYNHHTLQLRCFLMALKRSQKESLYAGEPDPALPSVNTILHAFVNREGSPSVGSSTTWFSSFVTLWTWWVKSSVGIPLWVGFPSDFKWLEENVNLSEHSDLLLPCRGLSNYDQIILLADVFLTNILKQTNFKSHMKHVRTGIFMSTLTHLLYWFTQLYWRLPKQKPTLCLLLSFEV